MKKLGLVALLASSAFLFFPDTLPAHGGVYRGPGDTVPPGGGGGGGGSSGTPAPPAPAGPAPTGSAGSGPGMAAPGTPAATQGPGGTQSPRHDFGPDLTQWSFWWEFNKDAYLQLKNAVHRVLRGTGRSNWDFGRGGASPDDRSLAPTREEIRTRVVPALLSALREETNNDIVTGAMIALAKIGEPAGESGRTRLEAEIVTLVADSNQEIAETAALSLGILGNDSSLPWLVSLLADDPEGRELVGGSSVSQRTRAFAAYALGLLGTETASEDVRRTIATSLQAVLDDEPPGARDLKIACMISTGLVPLESLDGEPQEGGPVRTRAGQLDYVLEFMERAEENTLVRAHAPTTLARLLEGLPPDVHAVYKERVAGRLLGKFARGVRARNEELQSAVLALGRIGDHDVDPIDEKIRDELMRVARDEADVQTRNFTMIALAQVGGRPGESERSDDAIEEVEKELIRHLTRGKETLKPWAGLAIGVLGAALDEAGVFRGARLATTLRAAYAEEKSPRRVGAYAVGLGLLGDVESKRISFRKLDRLRDDEARGYVALSLGMIGDQEAVEPIRRVVAEAKYRPDLLRQAAIALGLLGDKRLVGDLAEMLAEAKSLTTQAALCTALGFIGDASALDPLLRMLADEGLTESARGFSAVALGAVADLDLLPWNARLSVDVNYRASAETLNATSGTGVLNIL